MSNASEKPERRPCERYCPGCERNKHHSRFRSWKDARLRSGTSSVCFARLCRDCEQREKNERKNEDRPLGIIRGRANERAKKSGVPLDFIWVNMNYRSLVAKYAGLLLALAQGDAYCQSCGHHFDNERDIQIEHRAPPRHPQDWARLHARNLDFLCTACNGTKTDKVYEAWLDEQEECRLANESYEPPGEEVKLVKPFAQLSFFEAASAEAFESSLVT